jgi:osmoprotectant transport system ATP-binding protein
MRVRDADLGAVPTIADHLPAITADATLRDALNTMLGQSSDTVLVTENGRALGVLELAQLKAAVRPTTKTDTQA